MAQICTDLHCIPRRSTESTESPIPTCSSRQQSTTVDISETTHLGIQDARSYDIRVAGLTLGPLQLPPCQLGNTTRASEICRFVMICLVILVCFVLPFELKCERIQEIVRNAIDGLSSGRSQVKGALQANLQLIQILRVKNPCQVLLRNEKNWWIETMGRVSVL